MFRSGPLLAATSLTALVATGCAPPSTGSSEPTTSPETSASPRQAVTIGNPKNPKAVDDACSLLTSAQLDELGMQAKPEHMGTRQGAPKCDWSGDEFAITITPDVKNGGIDTLYKAIPNITKSTVAGYPAAWLNKQSISCRVEVGVSRDAKLGISYFSNTTSDQAGQVQPCKEGERIAAMVLKNIPDA